MRAVLALVVVLAAIGAAAPVHAGSVTVAVAANFLAVAEELGAAFKAETGDDLVISAGSTAALYAQILQGAPFDVLLSADRSHAEQAVADGLAVAGSGFTYAVGRLVLYAAPGGRAAGPETLAAGAFQHLAIADPATAPYGLAAEQTLAALGLTGAVADKLVMGTSISQTLAFVDSGNAELGFVALSQVIDRRQASRWVVPASLHAPIVQDAVLLEAGRANPAAAAFLEFLQSDEARAIIMRYGYGRP